MKRLKEILGAILAPLAFRFHQWRLQKQQDRAHSIKQHWQAGSLGGASVIQIGFMNRKQAIRAVNEMRTGPIVYIDDERGFIAFGNPPETLQ